MAKEMDGSQKSDPAFQPVLMSTLNAADNFKLNERAQELRQKLIKKKNQETQITTSGATTPVPVVTAMAPVSQVRVLENDDVNLGMTNNLSFVANLLPSTASGPSVNAALPTETAATTLELKYARNSTTSVPEAVTCSAGTPSDAVSTPVNPVSSTSVVQIGTAKPNSGASEDDIANLIYDIYRYSEDTGLEQGEIPQDEEISHRQQSQPQRRKTASSFSPHVGAIRSTTASAGKPETGKDGAVLPPRPAFTITTKNLKGSIPTPGSSKSEEASPKKSKHVGSQPAIGLSAKGKMPFTGAVAPMQVLPKPAAVVAQSTPQAKPIPASPVGLGIKASDIKPKGPYHGNSRSVSEAYLKSTTSLPKVNGSTKFIPESPVSIVPVAPLPSSVLQASTSTPVAPKPTKSSQSDKQKDGHRYAAANGGRNINEETNNDVVKSNVELMPTLENLLKEDSTLKLWLEATGYFDVEHRNRTLEPYRKLAELEDQRAKLVKEIEQSSGRPFIATPALSIVPATPGLSTSSHTMVSTIAQPNEVMSPLVAQKRAADDTEDERHPIPRKLQKGNDSFGIKTELVPIASRHNPAPQQSGSRPNSPRAPSISGRLFNSDSPDRRVSTHVVRHGSPTRGIIRTERPLTRPPTPRPLSERIDPRYEINDGYRDYHRMPPSGPRGSPYPQVQRPDLGPKGESIFFVMKSFTEDTVQACMEDGLWATQVQNGPRLVDAYKRFRNVILFFSVNKSKKFQGYARMLSPPHPDNVRPRWMNSLHWTTSDPFRVEWISTVDTGFHLVHHLDNPYNENRPVLVGKDGQEIEDECARNLIRIMDAVADGLYLPRNADRGRTRSPFRITSGSISYSDATPFRPYSRARSHSRPPSRHQFRSQRGSWWSNKEE